MSFVQRLDLRQTQTLVMTPQLQQAIKLLQLNNLEITDFIAEELRQNPLLEEDGRVDQDRPMDSAEAGQDRIDAAPAEGAGTADELAARIEAGGISELDGDIADGAAGGDEAAGYQGAISGGGNFDGEHTEFVERMSRTATLREHLLEQLNTGFDDPRDRLIGAALIEFTEPSGYLSERRETPATVAQMLGVGVETVEAILARMQTFDPAGVMARDLGECLAIQLRERDRFDPAMEALCGNLDMLADRKFSELTRVCGVDSADLADMIRELRALDPKPGDRFETTLAETIIPDILMRASRDGGWTIELNPDTLPRILVNRRYYAEISRSCREPKEKEYLAEKMNAANWLIRSLDQRANTILKVAGEIVNQQREFFLHGVSHLRPLVLRNIAEIIGMHESTVSRVTSNKYMSTPRGMFELKYFFSAAIQRADGEGAFAAESIRQRLKSLIDGESPNAILSDDTLVEKLQAEGIDIARRTVAKYREQLNIPSSVQRRRQKNFASAAVR
jgi:RNA polymerase sigma-54 factor